MVDTFKILITASSVAALAAAHPVARQVSTTSDAPFTIVQTTVIASTSDVASASATETARVADLSKLKEDCTIH